MNTWTSGLSRLQPIFGSLAIQSINRNRSHHPKPFRAKQIFDPLQILLFASYRTAFVRCTYPGGSLSKYIWVLTAHLVYPIPSSNFLSWSFLHHTCHNYYSYICIPLHIQRAHREPSFVTRVFILVITCRGSGWDVWEAVYWASSWVFQGLFFFFPSFPLSFLVEGAGGGGGKG